jgi:hypothetical protein
MSPNWNAYDREVEQLERDLADGAITMEEFRRQMRDLNDDLREAAREEADNYYRDMTGDW